MHHELSAIRSVGAEVIAVDPHESLSAQALLKEAGFDRSDVKFPVLADPSLTTSAAYGVAFQMRIHTEWSNRPATFIIDREGVIRYVRRGTSFGDRPSVKDILAELKKL